MPKEHPRELSLRERQVAEAYAQGLSYRQTAERLRIAPATVRTHLGTIYRKLGVSTKIELFKQLERTTSEPARQSLDTELKRAAADSNGRWWAGQETNPPAPRLPAAIANQAPLARLRADIATEVLPGLAGVQTHVDGSVLGWRARIAVLPFANLSGDERWTRLADGISEDIITDLARHGDLTVIARSSSFVFRGRDAHVREIGGQLGVRYLLEGSIQANGGRIRVTAQLVEAQTGAHLWAERYDRDEGDLFLVQDEIVQQVAGALLGWEGRISRAERRRAHRSRSSSLMAYERYLLAYEAISTGAETGRALDLAEAALALDPTLARAWLVRAYASIYGAQFGWVQDPEASMRVYKESVRRAYELDPADGAILIEMGDLQAKAGDIESACATYAEAARVAANHGDTLALLAKYFVGTLGRAEDARTMMRRAFRLNPGATPLYFYNQLRVAYLLGDFQDAVAAAQQAQETPVTKIYLAMSLAQLGRDEESAQVASILRREHPDFDPMWILRVCYLLDAGARAVVREGLRKVGHGDG